MSVSRRGFLKTVGLAGLGGGALGAAASPVRASGDHVDHDRLMGVLVDIPKCIGCRRCEHACQEAAGFDPPPEAEFEDKSVFEEQRRPHPGSFTVVNRYPNPGDEGQPLYNKFNCMHCLEPACVSACIVSAFSKRPDGPVVYDPGRCMGCRYCMVACPFEIPTYDYDNALTPQVRKCNLCAELVPGRQAVPNCVKRCPQEVLTYGRREDLLAVARERIRREPDVYVDHIYGEREAGGTSWLYLSSVPLEEVGFRYFDQQAPSRLTEAIQHGQFKHFLPPVMWYGLLGVAMLMTRPERKVAGGQEDTA